MFPYRGMLASWLLECLLLIAIIVLPERFESLQIPPAPTRLHWDVIYYSGDELPQTQDRGGAQAGKSGRAGGQQAHHRTQTIRVARGDKPSEKVVDAPRINLPHSDSAVANLLAFKANPGPPPAEGLRSTLTAPTLPADQRGAARAGIEVIGKPESKRTDRQRRPARTRSFSRHNAHFANVEHANRSARAERLARHNANRKSARDADYRTNVIAPASARRAARPGQFPRADDPNRRRGCAPGFRAPARCIVHAQVVVARSRR